MTEADRAPVLRRLACLATAALLAGCGAGSAPVFVAPPPVVVKPPPPPPVVIEPPAPVLTLFQQVQAIVQARCVACHSVTPTMPGFSSAPRGVRLDTEQQIRADAQRIYFNVVTTEFMPYGNQTKMTPQERLVIAAWYTGGAK
jgi:mono/diheme cytochrome c family protein